MLSIIVPVYNVKEYVIQCLETIKNQELKDYEVIVVNDGSTDGSEKLVSEFCGDKKNFKLIYKDNGGLMSAWMEGIKYAEGDYIGFVDSDDYIEKTMFKKMYAIAKNNEYDIVMCDRYDVCENGIHYLESGQMRAGEYVGKDIEYIYENILPKFNGWHITNARWNKIFRRDLFMNNTKYCEHLSRICEDRFIVPACMFDVKSFFYIKEPLYYYRHREGSNQGMYSKNLYAATKLVYETQHKMIHDKHLNQEYEKELDRAALNYLRLNINRNLLLKSSYKDKYFISKELLNDLCYQRIVREYGYDLTGKMGSIIKMAYKFQSPSILALACHVLMKKK